jgi:endonuclease-3
MTIDERYTRCIEWFQATNPAPATELRYGSPFQLLVAVILSAQCTDKRVNTVTPALFEVYPTADDMARATADDILALVKSCSYPNQKSRSLAAMARMLRDQYGGDVPSTLDELVKIPGVGRKTANVILSVVYGQAAMAVDTHVHRVAARIGLVPASSSVLATERALVKRLPRELVGKAHHWLILHGRYVCRARRPDCHNCGLTAVCRHFSKTSDKTSTPK